MADRRPRNRTGPARRTAVAVVVSRYNASITSRLLDGALRAARRRKGGGMGTVRVSVVEAPGSFELPFLASVAARTGRYDGVLALGCLIRGETRHDRYIAEAVAHGLTRASIDSGVPIAFGVLTVDSPGQARARAGGRKGNKGEESMSALLETIAAASALRSGARPARAERARPDKAARAGRGGRGGHGGRGGRGGRR